MSKTYMQGVLSSKTPGARACCVGRKAGPTVFCRPWEPLSGLGVVRALAGSRAANTLQLLQWLKGRGYALAREDYAVTAACSAGKLDVARWLVEEQGYPVGPDALPAAAGSGCCALVEVLLSRAHVPRDKGWEAYVAAGALGALDVLDVPWCNGVPWEPGIRGV